MNTSPTANPASHKAEGQPDSHSHLGGFTAFGVHPLGCPPPNTLKRGHQTQKESQDENCCQPEAGSRNNHRLHVLFLCAGLLASQAGMGAESPLRGEYQVKAAMLYNLTKYVDWPPESFPKTNSPIVIAILGEDNFGDDFKRMLEEKAINGRKLALQHMTWGDDLKSVHLLFVSAGERRRLPELIEKLRGVSVLTVGEADSFLELGGMINLPVKDNKIRPEVNLAAVHRARLQISSKLLSIAELVPNRSSQKKS